MHHRARHAAAGLTAAACLVSLAACGPVGGGSGTVAGAASQPPRSTSASGAAPSTTTRATSAAPTRAATRTTPSAGSGGPGSARLSPVPRAAVGPAVRFPANPPAVGTGANAAVSAVPDAVWSRMVGWSWTPGCPVGRSSLRYVTVNFWGFDGVRHRGALVVNAAIATPAARAFTRLYDQRFRIRQMKVMDRSWGHNPKGPGADDYAAMRADNTSAFNCRYVGGQEASRRYSGHAFGTAIDVNDYENPYRDDQGRTWPDTWFVRHRSPAAGVFPSSSSAPVRAFTALGFRWGGLWSAPDYQHFEVPR